MTALSALTDWANFYVITGSAAGGLMGLTFVVIALAANVRGISPTGMGAFVSPTIVHFGTVLGLAAFLSVPRQNVTMLLLAFGPACLPGMISSPLAPVT